MVGEIKKFFKYSIVGVSGTILDLVFLFIFVEFLFLGVILGSVLSFIIAATNNFIFNKIWTFNNKSKEYRHQYIKFLLVSIVGLIITVFLMFVFNTLIGIWYILAKLMTSGIVLMWNFLGNRLWTFKPDNSEIAKIDSHTHKYSIVIPAFNEEFRISKTLNIIDSYLKTQSINAEIVVVNDGSTDNTRETVKNISQTIKNIRLINLTENKGKGYAVRKGIESSFGEYVLMTDADNATPIEELNKFEKYTDDYDIVIGSRKMADSQILVKESFLRRGISRVGTFMTLSLVKDIKDTQCGFKLIKNNVARHIFSKQKTYKYGFDIELLALAQYYNYKIAEVPVVWSHDKESRVRPFKDAIKTFHEFIGIHYNFLTKRY